MVDPVGRFFQNTQGIYKYSESIQEVGVWEALRQAGFSWKKLVERGGSSYFTNGSSGLRSEESALGNVGSWECGSSILWESGWWRNDWSNAYAIACIWELWVSDLTLPPAYRQTLNFQSSLLKLSSFSGLAVVVYPFTICVFFQSSLLKLSSFSLLPIIRYPRRP